MAIERADALNAAATWDIVPEVAAEPARVASSPGGNKTVQNGDAFGFTANGSAYSCKYTGTGGAISAAAIVAGCSIEGVAPGDVALKSAGNVFAVETSATGASQELADFESATNVLAGENPPPYSVPGGTIDTPTFAVQNSGTGQRYTAHWDPTYFYTPRSAQETVDYMNATFDTPLAGSGIEYVVRDGKPAFVAPFGISNLGTNGLGLTLVGYYGYPMGSSFVDVLTELSIAADASSTGTDGVPGSSESKCASCSVERTGEGIYRVTLDNAAAENATCDVARSGADAPRIVVVERASASVRVVRATDADGAPVDAPCSFLSVRW